MIRLLVLAGCIVFLSSGCATPAPQEHPPISGTTPASAPQSSTLAKSFAEAVDRGDSAWNAGQTEMAVYLYIQALSFQPRDVTTLGKLGSIEQAQGDMALAARAFELAATADPSDPRLSGRLGLIQMALGNEAEAHKWLQLSVDSGSTDWRVLDQLSVIDNHQGNYGNALQYSRQAVALAPSLAIPVLHHGQALYGTGDYVRAEDAARTALRLGNLPDAWYLLGQIQAKLRAYPASIDSLLQSMDPAPAYNTAGKLAMDNGDNAIALHYFEKAAMASPVYLQEAQRSAAIARERLSASTGK